MAGSFDYKAKDLLKNLMVLASLRGAHSTGLLSIEIAKNSYSLTKCVGSPYDLFEKADFDKVASTSFQNVFIAHGRHATQGAITKANAHPFEAGPILGAHNGTLSNKDQLPCKDKYGTDSETLFNAINESGLEATIKKAKGAWALTWFDGDDGTLNFLRNDQRTLYYCFSSDKNKIFWASETWMLMAMMARHGIEVWREPKEDGSLGFSYFSFDKDHHYQFEVPTTASGEVRLVSKKEVKEGPEPQKPPFLETAKRWWPGQGTENPLPIQNPPVISRIPGAAGTTLPSTGSYHRPSSQSSSPPRPTLVVLPGSKKDTSNEYVRGHDGSDLNESEFKALLKGDGCVFCGLDVPFKPGHEYFWMDRHSLLGPCCFDENGMSPIALTG